MLIRWLVVLYVFSSLLFGCVSKEEIMRGSVVHITGDAQSVGADIYIDGQKVGVMEKRVFTDPQRKGEIFAYGVDIRIVTGEKKPEYGLLKDIRISSGKHEILFINKEGKRLKKEIIVQNENYIHVDFEKMIIQGGE